MKTRTLLLMLMAALPLVAFGCGWTDGGGSGTGATRTEKAPIDGIDILVRESYPPGYTAHITSGLPSGCAKFHSAEVTGRSGNTITVTVLNTMPADPNTQCTAIYGSHEANIDLGTEFVSGQTYTVEVNDKTKTFVAQ